MDRRHVLSTLAASLAAGWLPTAAFAQDKFPSRGLRVIVGYPAGGVTDIAARVVGDIIAKKYGHPVVVENRPGASGVIGQQLVAKAPPDGYTLSSGGLGGNVLPPLTVDGLPLDVLKSLVPVALTAEFVNVLVVSRDHPANSVASFIKDVKARNKPLLFGANGIGSSAHLAGEFFGTRADVKMEVVSYKGAADILVDVVNGGLECTFANLPSVLPLLKNGRIKALAVTSNYRSKHVPDVVTMEESGIPDFNVTSWLGMYVTAGTPQPIIDQLSRDIVEGLQNQSSEGRRRLETAGLEVRPLNAADFASFTQKELDKWGDVVKRLGIKQKFGG